MIWLVCQLLRYQSNSHFIESSVFQVWLILQCEIRTHRISDCLLCQFGDMTKPHNCSVSHPKKFTPNTFDSRSSPFFSEEFVFRATNGMSGTSRRSIWFLVTRKLKPKLCNSDETLTLAVNHFCRRKKGHPKWSYSVNFEYLRGSKHCSVFTSQKLEFGWEVHIFYILSHYACAFRFVLFCFRCALLQRILQSGVFQSVSNYACFSTCSNWRSNLS